MVEAQLIPVDKVVLDKKLYPREFVDSIVVARYRTCLENGDEFPPIMVCDRDGKYILVDGAHRLEAYKKNKEKKILAVVKKGLNDATIFTLAIQTNAKHGRQMTSFELTKAIIKLKELGVNKKDICAIVSIPSAKIDGFFGKRTLVLTNSLTGKPVIQALKRPFHFLANDDEAVRGAVNIESINLSKFAGVEHFKLVSDLIDLLDEKLFHKTKKNVEKLKELQSAITRYLKS